MKKLKLFDIVNIKIGRTPSRSNIEYWGAGYDWLTISDLSNLQNGKYITKSNEQITGKATIETGCSIIEPGTVLFSFKLTIGKVAITQKPFYTNEAIAALIIKDHNEITPDYLFYALKNLGKTGFEDHGAKGVTLNKSKLERIQIPVPDLEIQNRIVTTLDKIQSLIDKRKKTITLLDELVRATFLEMFGEIKNGWQKGTFNDIIEKTQYGISKPLITDTTAYPVLRMNNITTKGTFDLKELKWAKLSQEDAAKYELKRGDLVFNRTNSRELVGKVAVWDNNDKYYFAGYLVRLKAKTDLANPYFVSGLLNSSYGKKMLFTYAKSSGNQANFSPPLLLQQFFFVPPLELQNNYEKVVKMAMSQQKNLEVSLQKIEETFQIILKKAFSSSGLGEKSEVNVYLNDIILQEELIHKIKNQEFQIPEEYDKAQSLLFKLLETKQSSIQQVLGSNKAEDGSNRAQIKIEMAPKK